jgi:voltage-gated potassium channel
MIIRTMAPEAYDPERADRDASQTTRARRRTPLGRSWDRFLENPASPRNAVIIIVIANLTIVGIGGVIIWLIDRPEYERLLDALWYTLQTITTVGYGDVTPTHPAGRLVGAAIMLLGIASLSILTATITSSFVEARQAARQAREDADERVQWASLEAKLDALIERLERLEHRGTDRDPDA